MPVRPLLIVAALITAFSTEAAVGAGAAGAVPIDAPSIPSDVRVVPGVGQLKVSWSATGRQLSYEVRSTPEGLSCTVTRRSCTFPATTSTPWRFSVRAINTSGRSSWSEPSAAIAVRTLLIIAGQSNASGWESYPVDPVSGVDYLAAPYANGADAVDRLEWMPWLILPGMGRTWTTLNSPQRWNWPGVSEHRTFFGPELGLARQLWADTGRSAFVIKETYPGSWLTTTWNIAGGPGSVAPAAFDNIMKTMKRDSRAGVLDSIGAVYWVQGEADATLPEAAAAYQANLTALIRAFRSQLPMNPAAPFAIAKIDITSWTTALERSGTITADTAAAYRSGNDAVRAADDAVAHTVPGTVEVDTAGLARVNGLIHLSNVAELSLGASLAIATERLIP